MVLQPLISLGESMMVDVASFRISVATEVRLGSTGFLNLDVDSFDLNVIKNVTYLIVLHSDLDGEFVRHNKSISFN